MGMSPKDAVEDAGEDNSEGWVPSGEVAPIPAVELVCAQAAATPLIQIIAARVQARRIDVSRIEWHKAPALRTVEGSRRAMVLLPPL
jgi:hypothetical protein